MKFLLESWKSYTEELLNEIKMEQVTPRFESKAFLNAAGVFLKSIENDEGYWGPEGLDPLKIELELIVPRDIQEKYKPEALNWIITAFINNPNKNIFSRTNKLLETFYQIKEAKMDRILSKKDIYSIKDVDELVSVIGDATDAWNDYKHSKAEKDAGAGTNKIYEDDRWEVYIPENKGAACKLGKGTDWCTAAPGLEYYKQYHKPEDPLIIFISKENPSEKYQLHYGTEQFMDKDDHPIDKGFRYELHSIVAKSDNIPEQIREKAKILSKNYERLPNGGYKLEGKFGGRNTSIQYYNSDGRFHREDGPAIIDNIDGEKSFYWYLDGKAMSQEEWQQKRKQQNLQEMIVQELRKLIQERKLGKPSSETNLGDWFKRKGAPGKKGGWVDCNTCRDGKCKPCGRQEGEKRSKYPRCRPTPSQCKGYKRRGSNLQREE